MSNLHDLDAEQALLGAVLFDNRLWHRVSLRPEHFYDGVHALIWTEISNRIRADRAVDAVALKDWWKAQEACALLGVGYLLDLLDRAVKFVSVGVEYADMLRDLARRRAVEQAAAQAMGMAQRGGEDALTALEARLQEIAASDTDADAWASLSAVAAGATECAELGEARGISTGIQRLDEITGGIQPGTLWVVGGATSMGKSVFGAALSRNIAAQGYGVGEVHLEMDDLQIGLRASSALAFSLANQGGGNPKYLNAMRQALRPEQWGRLRAGALAAAKLPIYVDARPGRSLAQIEAAARRLFRRMLRDGTTPGALVIDHEGLIAADQRYPSQLERANARGEGLLAMAKRLGVGVVALSQITKEGSRADGEERLPTALDLNYGGAISQAASVVILLHRKAYYAERKPRHLRTTDDLQTSQSRDTTLVVDKARGGMRDQVEICMDMATAAVFEAGRAP